MRKKIKIKYLNGIDENTALTEILNVVEDLYDFEISESPDFVLFGPYGNDIPPKGDYIRIGYFCENIIPDLSTCEWAFGVPRENEINHPNYKRIQWHGLDPHQLIKKLTDNDIDRIYSSKTSFCNFLYSHKVPYREEFFKQLSKYKKVDAPGKSMNNMPSIDQLYKGDIWERKRQFLSPYKFTIAFENYVYPGYQTEKLYDAMQSNSIPIYCGDPYIHEIFNTTSFLNTEDFITKKENRFIHSLEKNAQLNLIDILPKYYKSPQHRLQRKIKDWAKKLKMSMQYRNLDFSPLIDEIIKIDRDPQLYKNMLSESWFLNNEIPEHLSTVRQWNNIFNKK